MGKNKYRSQNNLSRRTCFHWRFTVSLSVRHQPHSLRPLKAVSVVNVTQASEQVLNVGVENISRVLNILEWFGVKKRGLKNNLRVREMKKPRRTSSLDVCLLDFGVIGVGNDSWISSTTLGSVILFLSRKSTLCSYQSLLQMNTNSILAHELIFTLNIVNNSAQYTLWHCCRRYVCLAASQILGTHDHKLY